MGAKGRETSGGGKTAFREHMTCYTTDLLALPCKLRTTPPSPQCVHLHTSTQP